MFPPTGAIEFGGAWGFKRVGRAALGGIIDPTVLRDVPGLSAAVMERGHRLLSGTVGTDACGFVTKLSIAGCWLDVWAAAG